MQLKTVKIEKPDDTNFVLGQTHFIKSVEDIHEARVTTVPGIKFGLAFCEASGKCLVARSGTDPAMTELAKKNAAVLGAGHSFILFLGDGFYPLNVLNTLKMVPEVCRIFLRHGEPHGGHSGRDGPGARHLGRGGRVLPKGVEDEDEIKWRKDFCARLVTNCDRGKASLKCSGISASVVGEGRNVYGGTCEPSKAGFVWN